MSQWKLATVLLGASFAAAISCLIAAAQLWEYVYPRSIFLNASVFFTISAMAFLFVVIFLDDLSAWIKSIKSSAFRSLLSLLFAALFTIFMASGLYFGAIGGKSLSGLSICTFEKLDTVCTKKQSDLTDIEINKIKKPFNYHFTFDNHPFLTKIVKSASTEH